jgi:hypothetical protein
MVAGSLDHHDWLRLIDHEPFKLSKDIVSRIKLVLGLEWPKKGKKGNDNNNATGSGGDDAKMDVDIVAGKVAGGEDASGEDEDDVLCSSEGNNLR